MILTESGWVLCHQKKKVRSHLLYDVKLLDERTTCLCALYKAIPQLWVHPYFLGDQGLQQSQDEWD